MARLITKGASKAPFTPHTLDGPGEPGPVSFPWRSSTQSH